MYRGRKVSLSQTRTVKSHDSFRESLVRERAVCDRKGQEFSLLAFELESPTASQRLSRLVQVLGERIRQTDEAGWLDQKCLAVLLPDTPPSGARTVAQDLCELMGSGPPNCSIYSYPGQWAQGETSGRPDIFFTGPIPAWKRPMDIFGAVIGLALLWPLLVLIAAVIKIVSPGPALLKQERVGRHGKVFTLWKFRTMRTGADVRIHQNHLNSLIATDGPMTKLDAASDPRIFSFGRILRCTYLDELPQLINVLLGDMSLVGPRPCTPYEAQEYSLWQTRRFDAAPGMTGLWQVSGKNRTTFKEMMRLDITYSRRQSFWLDATILLKTIPAILAELAFRRPEKTAIAPNCRRGVSPRTQLED